MTFRKSRTEETVPGIFFSRAAADCAAFAQLERKSWMKLHAITEQVPILDRARESLYTRYASAIHILRLVLSCVGASACISVVMPRQSPQRICADNLNYPVNEPHHPRTNTLPTAQSEARNYCFAACSQRLSCASPAHSGGCAKITKTSTCRQPLYEG